MTMEKLVVSFVAALFQSLSASIIIFKQTNEKRIKNKVKFFILMWIYGFLCFLFISNHFRFFTFLIFCSIITILSLNIKDSAIVIYSFNVELLSTISEIIVTFVLVFVGIKSSEIVNNYFYNLLANILISILSILFINIKLFKVILRNIINFFKKEKRRRLYFYIVLIVFYLVASKNGLQLLFKSNYYVNILILVSFIVIIYLVMRNEFKAEKLNDENKQMLNYVTKYEKIITDQGKANHEFKNQLMVIYGYAKMGSPKLVEYIESIIEDTRKTQSSYLISQLNKFPDGGIKGLLYYKLSVMDDLKIKYDISVEQGVKTKLKNLSVSMNKDITKSLGVLLDNAIDSVSKCKDKKIIISVTKEKNNVLFTIQNTYKGKIDIKRIGTGYTTKGNGHGYGLRLLNDITGKNRNLKIINFLEDEYFSCKFIITIRNKKKK